MLIQDTCPPDVPGHVLTPAGHSASDLMSIPAIYILGLNLNCHLFEQINTGLVSLPEVLRQVCSVSYNSRQFNLVSYEGSDKLVPLEDFLKLKSSKGLDLTKFLQKTSMRFFYVTKFLYFISRLCFIFFYEPYPSNIERQKLQNVSNLLFPFRYTR